MMRNGKKIEKEVRNKSAGDKKEKRNIEKGRRYSS
jgi:hypothetical protein